MSDPRTGSGSGTAVPRLTISSGVAFDGVGVSGAPAARRRGTIFGVVAPHAVAAMVTVARSAARVDPPGSHARV